MKSKERRDDTMFVICLLDLHSAVLGIYGDRYKVLSG